MNKGIVVVVVVVVVVTPGLNIDCDLIKQLTGQRELPNKSRHLDELTHKPAI